MSADDPTLILPDGDGPHPGVVLGAEAYGVNEFIVEVGEQLAAAGYAVLIPDYYRGDGPENREAYDDFDEVVEHIGRLDFTDATRVLVDGIDQLRNTPGVDSVTCRRLGVLHGRDGRVVGRVPDATSPPRCCSSRASRVSRSSGRTRRCTRSTSSGC